MPDAIILAIAAATLGAIIGSFLNALSFRFNTGRGVVWARSTSLRASRSRCMHCGHALSPLDLVPIFSFLFLRGRCRYCEARISLQYPLVEGVAAILGFIVYLTHPEPLAFVFWLLVWMTLLFVVVYDLRHQIIPWSCSIFLIVLALVYLLAGHHTNLVGVVAGPLLAAPLLLISAVSRGRWMGWGDGVLQLSLGWFLGLSLGLTALMLAFWIGAVVGIALILLKKGLTMKSEVPFAPFLVLGALFAHFFHVDFFQNLSLFW